ncbi:aspartic peptidase domain-containing protein [Paraphoma chrysanthemicola]|uniref:Aspartic peptidase domain-containing protein n=1 Tax=Paraphoma chrysanthemicola TaxID=798071 RepID=A0A8K0QRN0_9PLEO|nr:aspartic peptidase domain-containing protein [Paraphoma chrysanthemicola]
MRSLVRLWVIFVTASFYVRAQYQAQPLSVPPTGRWEGIDGPWSTFILGVGDPLQSFGCVPALSIPVVFLPTESQQCNGNSSGACANRTTFQPGKSKAYKKTGTFTAFFGDFVSLLFNATGGSTEDAAPWGQDHVWLGNDTRHDIGLATQYVVAVESLDFFVGSFGLAIGATSPTGVSRQTLLSALVNLQVIPSYSVSYTAGSFSSDSTGSLILGGYDATRLDPKTTKSFNMTNQQNNTLMVYLKEVAILGFRPRIWLGSTEIPNYSFRIESVVPQMWLPKEACAIFEAAFHLTWNNDLGIYTLNETTRDSNLQQNLTIRFTLGISSVDGASQEYFFQYSAFDLQLYSPRVNTSTYYFPLKVAKYPSEYVLGRAFLQETYITIDYERSNFSLSQARAATGPSNIVPILNSTSSTGGRNGTTNTGSTKQGLTPGASAGIGVGVGALALAVVGFVLRWRKKWIFSPKKANEHERFEKSELHGIDKSRVEAMEKQRAELEGTATVEAMSKEAAELETVETSQEAGILSPTVGGVDEIHELDGDQGRSSESSPDQEGMSRSAVVEPRT